MCTATLDEMLLKPKKKGKKIRKEVFLKLLLCSYSILLFQTFVATSRLLERPAFHQSKEIRHKLPLQGLRVVGIDENLEGQVLIKVA